MKFLILTLVVLLISNIASAGTCVLDRETLTSLKGKTEYELDYSVKVPVPDVFFELLNKHFGKFSKVTCIEAISVTKISNKNTSEYYFAIYTNHNDCDQGNSYGVIFKGKDSLPHEPYGLIEDSYFECL